MTIRRQNVNENPYFQEYRVAFDNNNDISIMNILEEIYTIHDSTLSFFSHAACRQAACGRCLVKINGVIKLACKEKVTTDALLIEPYKDQVIRDLICVKKQK